MNFFKLFDDHLAHALDALESEGVLPAGIDRSRITVEPPRDPEHGDVATNAAMVLSKPAGMKPRDLAEQLAPKLDAHDAVEAVDVAGPGFINLRLAPAFWHARLGEILASGEGYGDSDVGQGTRVNVEYVSANPTGPLHTAHARGAVVGDVLVNLLAKAGHEVTREYYINDAGAQVDTLARSTHLRYQQALGRDIGEIPSGYYPGDYLIPVGEALAERDGERWLDQPETMWLEPVRRFAIDAMMALVRDDLDGLGIHHDVFTSEDGLVTRGAVREAFDVLMAQGHIYRGVLEPPKGKAPEDWEPREQTLFRATAFGDDVDRPLVKSDGSWTYFASDIAYHLDKYRRGFGTLINVWGADHGGYVKRMEAAVKAVTGGGARLDVKICQLVNMYDGGKPVRMSKRAGTFVTLGDVVDRVGKDVVRFIMVTRRNDQALDFDFETVTEQSKDNPVFYVQYAHARCRSVLRHAVEEQGGDSVSDEALARADVSRLVAEEEIALLRKLALWPRTVESAAAQHEPHRVAFYLHDVASAFHQLWNRGREDATLRFLLDDDQALTMARLALVRAVSMVIASGLGVMGVQPVEEMRE